MACAISPNNRNNDEMNDTILQFLEKIRIEYCNFKKEKDAMISALQKSNLNLTKTINNLNDEINCTYGSPLKGDKKRRKTDSSESSEIESSKLFGRAHVSILDSMSDKSSSESVFGKGQSPLIIKENYNKKMNSSSDSDLDNAKLFSRINIDSSCSASDKSLNRDYNKAAKILGSQVMYEKKYKIEHFSDNSDLENYYNSTNCINIIDSGSDKSIDNDFNLNEAINDDINIMLDDSEMLFPSTQVTNLQTPSKKIITSSPPPFNKKLILSPKNCNIIRKSPIKDNIPTPPLIMRRNLQLPKRMKSMTAKNNPTTTSSTSSSNNENKNPIKKNNDGWISSKKQQINQKTKNNWNMSFIQPVKNNAPENNLNLSGDVIACSQDITIKPIKKERNKSTLKHSPKLRQAKLEFDLKIRQNEGDETFCEDIVGASPTTNSKSTMNITRTLRKNTRKKTDDDLFVFPMKKSLSDEFIAKKSKEIKPAASTTTTSITPTKNPIKIEPKTVVKKLSNMDDVLSKTKFFEHMLTDDSIEGLQTIIHDDDNDNIKCENKDNTAKKMLNDDSSLFILPSQPDDVIIVEDTDLHDYNLSSMDLLAEMLKDEKDTQPLLKKFEAQQIKSLQSIDNNNKKSISTPSTSRLQIPQNKKKSIDNDETKLSEIFDDKNDFTTNSFKIPEQKGFHHDCDECQKFRKYLVGQNVPEDEIERRLRTCKKPQKLHHTPDGFWDPCFRELPPDDPRNEVLIDYRFVNKKKEQKRN